MSVQSPSGILKGTVAKGRDRALTHAEKKTSIMSKNLIVEDDDELVDETDGLGSSSKKLGGAAKNGAQDEDNDDYSDDFD